MKPLIRKVSDAVYRQYDVSTSVILLLACACAYFAGHFPGQKLVLALAGGSLALVSAAIYFTARYFEVERHSPLGKQIAEVSQSISLMQASSPLQRVATQSPTIPLFELADAIRQLIISDIPASASVSGLNAAAHQHQFLTSADKIFAYRGSQLPKILRDYQNNFIFVSNRELFHPGLDVEKLSFDADKLAPSYFYIHSHLGKTGLTGLVWSPVHHNTFHIYIGGVRISATSGNVVIRTQLRTEKERTESASAASARAAKDQVDGFFRSYAARRDAGMFQTR